MQIAVRLPSSINVEKRKLDIDAFESQNSLYDVDYVYCVFAKSGNSYTV
jgi:hypothetical protein